MQPVFIVNGHDYTEYIPWDGLKPSYNDLDKDNSGRNILTGLMYRKRITTKVKYDVTFLRMGSALARQLINDINKQYITVTLLDAKTNTQSTKTYYTSTINVGVQRYVGGDTVYDGISFSITER